MDDLYLQLENMAGFVSHGAAVMTGRQRGLATQLKEIIPSLLSFHCICHKLALACGDTVESIGYLQKVCDYLTELWKLLPYSNQRTAIFVKVQLNLSTMMISNQQKTKVAKTVKKAVKTHWYSSENSVSSAIANFSAIILTLNELKVNDI